MSSPAASRTPSDTAAPADHAGQHIIVVGGGNSGAQIAADLAYATDPTQVTGTRPASRAGRHVPKKPAPGLGIVSRYRSP